MRSQERRSGRSSQGQFNTGPFIGRIVSHLDQTFMGGLRVQILSYNDAQDDYQQDAEVITCFYAPPFYGTTPASGNTDGGTYMNTTQSYGMWFVPPDVGTKVLVMLVEGRRDVGYWFACVPEEFMNFMIPDGRASTINNTRAAGESSTEIPEIAAAAQVKVPVGEYNKATIDPQGETQPTNYPKPPNDLFIETLMEQGLLEDDIRGTTSTSARRELPSAVFGVSTPGPLDKRDNAPTANLGILGDEILAPTSRLGGSSIVMDDGDDKFLRAGSPENTPSEYVDVERGVSEGGDVTRPANELIRLRTRTGHQILLHNTEDLIYIGNSRGTSWIEMTSNGKIDIFANDSISVHTEQDLNFTADRDINFNAGKNMNITVGEAYKASVGSHHNTTVGEYYAVQADASITHKAGTFIADNAEESITHNAVSGDSTFNSGGGLCVNASKSISWKTGENFRIQTGQNFDVKSTGGVFLTSTESDLHLYSNTQMNLHTGASLNLKSDVMMNFNAASNLNMQSDGTIRVTGDTGINFTTPSAYNIWAEGNINAKSDTGIYLWSAEETSIKADSTLKVESGGQISVKSTGGNIDMDGSSDIHLNSGTSTTASEAFQTEPVSIFAPEAFFASEGIACPEQPAVTPLPADPINRVPMHEPWTQHENINPLAYTPENTRAGVDPVDSFKIPIPDTFVNIGANRNTTGTVTSSVSAPTATGDTPGETDDREDLIPGEISPNAQTAFNFMKNSLGMSDAQAAGVVGNLMVESFPEVNPKAFNSTGGGQGAQGIAQWRGARIRQFEKLYNKRIIDASLQEQLAYIKFELEDTSTPQEDGNTGAYEGPARLKVLEKMKATVTPREAATVWEAKFERAGGHALAERIRQAEAVFLASKANFALQDTDQAGTTHPQGSFVVNGEVFESDPDAADPRNEQRNVPLRGADVVTYHNQSAKRGDKISGEMIRIFNAAARATGVSEVQVVSGGQAPKGHPLARQGSNRTRNSTRHDCVSYTGGVGAGHAADVDLIYNGRKLDGRRASDQPILTRFMQVCQQQGMRGFGWEPGYMGSTRYHFDLYGQLSYCPGAWSNSRNRASPAGRPKVGPTHIWGANFTIRDWISNGRIKRGKQYTWFPKALGYRE